MSGLWVQLSAVGGLTQRGILTTTITLPVVVNEEFAWTKDAGHYEYDTVGEGTFSQPMGGDDSQKLAMSSLDMMTLTWNPDWLAGPGYDPQIFIDILENVLDARSPFHMFCWLPEQGTIELDIYATLRRMDVRLRHGETDTRYITLEFMEYRQPILQRLAKRGRAGRSSKQKPKLPTKHKLDENDTMRSLSRRYYGTPNKWDFIAVANGIKGWGADDPLVKMARFKVGESITISDAGMAWNQ